MPLIRKLTSCFPRPNKLMCFLLCILKARLATNLFFSIERRSLGNPLLYAAFSLNIMFLLSLYYGEWEPVSEVNDNPARSELLTFEEYSCKM